MKFIYCLLLFSILFSCSYESKKNDEISIEVKAERNNEIDSSPIAEITNRLDNFEVNRDSLPFQGKLIKCVSWHDGRGKNKIVFSHRPQYFWAEENPSMGKFTDDPENEMELTEIFAYHYIWSDSLNKWKSYWTLHDFLFGCCDVYMELIPVVKIVDDDHDGKAESLFFYTIGGGTMSIDHYYRAKMIYHVGKTKLKVEGTTGKGKEIIEAPRNGGEPVIEKYYGFTGKFENYKQLAEHSWNYYHQSVLYYTNRYSEEETISE